MTTNYYKTLIQIAEDSPIAVAEVPIAKNGKPTIASMQYDYERLATDPTVK